MTELNSPARPIVLLQPWRSMLIGSLGFTVVSLAAFAVWAWGGGWFRGRGDEPAMYAAIAAVFLLLSGALLQPLVRGPRRWIRFHQVFTLAFLAYSIVWSACWFTLGFGWGEWLGALLGSLAFVSVTSWFFHSWERWTMAVLVFFALHTIGYFAGGRAMYQLWEWSRMVPVPPPFDKSQWRTLAMLSWGLFYGLGFGAGLGYVLESRQPRR